MRREFFSKAKRIVIKIGTSAMMDGRVFSSVRVRKLVDDICSVLMRNKELGVVLVSSGAIGAGMALIGRKNRPTEMAQLQALAAAGQPKLISCYDEAFSKHGRHAAQILVTWQDFSNRIKYASTKKTLEQLIKFGIVPVINENDTISTKEIEFGDNDQLSSMVASMYNADLLILLSDSNGFYGDVSQGEKSRISMISDLNAEHMAAVQDVSKQHSKGGMTSKLGAISKTVKTGIPCLLADGTMKSVISRLYEGEDLGTLFLPKLNRLSSKKHWIAYISKAEGALVIDRGAKTALLTNGKSLLSKGIASVEGRFEAGASVNLKAGEGGGLLGKGIVNFSSRELKKILDHRTDEWSGILGRPCANEVVHRDNFVKKEKN